MDMYAQVKEMSLQIERELRCIGRWSDTPLPGDRYVNMGAFGSNTMSFEEWLQFILIPRIDQIVQERGELPSGSSLGTYAIQTWGGDPDVGPLHRLLCELDDLVNMEFQDESMFYSGDDKNVPEVISEVVSIDGTTIPPVLYTLAGLLPSYMGDDLEAQLQTFDTFLEFLSASVRPAISKLLFEAASNTVDDASRKRLEDAGDSVLRGGRAAAPYDHEEAMKKYREDHARSFPES